MSRLMRILPRRFGSAVLVLVGSLVMLGCGAVVDSPANPVGPVVAKNNPAPVVAPAKPTTPTETKLPSATPEAAPAVAPEAAPVATPEVAPLYPPGAKLPFGAKPPGAPKSGSETKKPATPPRDLKPLTPRPAPPPEPEKPAPPPPPANPIVAEKNNAEELSWEFAGHVGAVSCIRYTADFKKLVTGGEDGVCRLWDLEALKEIATAKVKLAGKVQAIGVTHDAARVYNADDDGIIHEWDAKSGEELRTLRGHEGVVTALIVMGENDMISAGHDGKVLRWDLKAGTHVPFSSGGHPEKPIARCAVRPDAKAVTVTTTDGEVCLISTDEKPPIPEALKARALLTTLAPSSSYVAGLEDGSLRFSLFDGKQRLSVDRKRLGSPVMGVVLSTDESNVALLDKEGRFEHWSTGPVYMSSRRVIKADGITCAAFSGDMRQIAMGTSGGLIRIVQPPLVRQSLNDMRAAFIKGCTEHLVSGDFDLLDRLAAKLRGEQTATWSGEHLLSLFYASLATEQPTLLGGTPIKTAREKWRKERPQSKAVLLATAQAHIYDAWKHRGGGFANTVTEEGARLYHENLKAVQIMHLAADALPEKDPAQYGQAIEAAKGLGLPREEVDKEVEKLMKCDPRFFPAHQAMAEYLLPRWHGEPGDIEEYAAKVADKIGGDAGAEVYAWIASRVLRYNASFEFFNAHSFEYARLKQGLQSLLKRSTILPTQMHELALYAELKQDTETARDAFGKIEKIGLPVDTRIWGSDAIFQSRKRTALRDVVESPTKLKFLAHWGEVYNLWYSADGKTLFTFGTGRRRDVQVWNAETGESLGSIPLLTASLVGTAALSPDLRVMAVAEGAIGSSVLVLHDLAGENEPKIFRAKSSNIRKLVFSPDGKRLASCQDNGASLWNLENPQEDPQILKIPKSKKGPHVVAFAPDGKSLYGAIPLGMLIWDLTTGEMTETAIPKARSLTRSLRFTPDGAELIRGDDIAHVNWNLERKEATLIEPQMAAGGVDISPNGKLLSSNRGDPQGTPNGTVCLWDLKMKRLLATFETPAAMIWATRFSPDGKTLAASGADGVIRQWDISKFVE